MRCGGRLPRGTSGQRDLRRANAHAWNLLIRRLLDVPVRDIDCAFKLFRREALAGTRRSQATGAMFSAELLARIVSRGARLTECPVGHLPREAGVSSGGGPARHPAGVSGSSSDSTGNCDASGSPRAGIDLTRRQSRRLSENAWTTQITRAPASSPIAGARWKPRRTPSKPFATASPQERRPPGARCPRILGWHHRGLS